MRASYIGTLFVADVASRQPFPGRLVICCQAERARRSRITPFSLLYMMPPPADARCIFMNNSDAHMEPFRYSIYLQNFQWPPSRFRFPFRRGPRTSLLIVVGAR